MFGTSPWTDANYVVEECCENYDTTKKTHFLIFAKTSSTGNTAGNSGDSTPFRSLPRCHLENDHKNGRVASENKTFIEKVGNEAPDWPFNNFHRNPKSVTSTTRSNLKPMCRSGDSLSPYGNTWQSTSAIADVLQNKDTNGSQRIVRKHFPDSGKRRYNPSKVPNVGE